MAGMRAVLRQYSLSRFHIEYDIYKTNHLLHGVVALCMLGAGRREMENFSEGYYKKLLPAPKEEGHLAGDDWKALISKHERFPDLCRFFRADMEKRGSITDAISHYVPQMLDGGISCSAFHPIIHIGYSIMANSAEDVADGLAYLVYASRKPQPENRNEEIVKILSDPDAPRLPQYCSLPQPCKETSGFLSHPLCSLLFKVRRDEKLHRFLPVLKERIADRRQSIIEETRSSVFNNSMFLSHDHILDIVEPYLDGSGLFDGVEDEAQLTQLFGAVLQGVVLVYASTEEPDDFFVLHGLTSSWALKEVLPHLPDFQTRLQAVRLFCRDLIVAYVIRNMPDLVPWQVPDDLPSWEQIKQRAMVDEEEHLIKVVMTCYLMEQEFGELLFDAKVYRAVAAFKAGLLAWPRSCMNHSAIDGLTLS